MRRCFFAMLLVGLWGCATTIPLSPRYAVSNAAELIARVEKNGGVWSGFVADLRLSYFGKEGRLKAEATVLVKRPGSLRYELRGPHGGVLSAFAMNSHEVSLADFRLSRYLHGPSNPKTIDALIGLVPLNLPAHAWVKLVFGEVDIPGDAQLTYDATTGLYNLAWVDPVAAGAAMRVSVRPSDATLVSFQVSQGERVISRVEFEDRNAAGVPQRALLQAPDQDAQVELELVDIVERADIDDARFDLPPPPGTTPHSLGD